MIETKCKPALCPWGLAPTLAGDGDNRMLHVNRECGTSAIFCHSANRNDVQEVKIAAPSLQKNVETKDGAPSDI